MTRHPHPETDSRARAWFFRGVFSIDALVIAALCASCTGCGGGSESPRAATASCAAPTTVALLGDSTMAGQGSRIQVLMDARFGAGKVVVTNYGVPGSRAFQAPHVEADVVVANYGINDMNSIAPEDFRAEMAGLGATLLETQNPTVGGDRAPLYVDIVRGLGLPVADTYAFVLARPDWQADLRDGVHPTDELYDAIASDVLGPAIAGQVAARRCAS